MSRFPSEWEQRAEFDSRYGVGAWDARQTPAGAPSESCLQNTQEQGNAMPTKPRAGEHTKGPWRLHANFADTVSAGPLGEKSAVARCEPNGQAQDNARRIVACVNACEGVENTELEDLAALKCAVPGVAGVAQMAILNDTLEAANNELVAALEAVVDSVTTKAEREAIDSARALLAKHGR